VCSWDGAPERLTTYAASYSLELTSQPHIWYNVSHAGGILGIGFLRVRPETGGLEDHSMGLVGTPRTARVIPFLIVVYFVVLPAHAQYSGGSGTAEERLREGKGAAFLFCTSPSSLLASVPRRLSFVEALWSRILWGMRAYLYMGSLVLLAGEGHMGNVV